MVRPLVALLAAAAVVVGLAGPAHAQRTERDDPVGDVFRTATGGAARLSRTVANTDATRVVVDHRRARLLTSVTYDSLSRAGFEEIYLLEYLHTSNGDKFSVVVGLDRHFRHATVQLSVFPDGDQVRCPGARTTVNHALHRVRWALPRACLGNPQLLQVRGSAGSVTDDGREYGDDLMSEDRPDHRWTRQLRAG